MAAIAMTENLARNYGLRVQPVKSEAAFSEGQALLTRRRPFMPRSTNRG